MNREEYEKTLQEKHATSRIARVAMPLGAFAYVREPTPDEYMHLQSLDDETRRIEFRAYVKGCFVGAIDADGNVLSFDDVQKRAGVAFVAGGALGNAVNKLAGVGEAPTTFL